MSGAGFKLRDYQTKAQADCRQAFAEGAQKIVLQSPTGGGKTVIAAQIIKGAVEKGSSVLFFAHRRELVYQCSDKLEAFGIDHAMIMSGEFLNRSEGVQICSIDTFRARALKGRIKMPPAKLVIIDEAHRSLSATYLKVIKHYEEEGAAIIGLTATPVRSDGKGLGRIYDHMVRTVGVVDMIAQGHLVEPKHYAPTIPDLTGVKTKAGDYDQSDLQEAMDNSALVGDVISNWLRLASDRQTVVFASGVRHSIHLKDEFIRAGVKAAHLDGNTKDGERTKIIEDLKSGEIQVVCNCMVLTEGFDEPSLSCCVLARPTKNYGLYVQMGGRVLRPFRNKDNAMIIDHSGAIYRHGKLNDPYEWTLEMGKRPEKDINKEIRLRERTVITCFNCSNVYSGQLVCPECGHEPEMQGRFVVSKTGDLVAIQDVKRPVNARDWSRYERVKWFNQFIKHARDRGYKRGWAHNQYKNKFKEWPEQDFPEFEHVVLEPEFSAWIRHLNIKYAYGKRAEEKRRRA